MKGHLEEVRPGTWRAWFDLPRGEDGRRRQKKVTFAASGIREAQSRLAKLITAAEAGHIAAPSKTTLEGYILGWLAHRKAGGIAPKTCETWEMFARVHIVPRLGTKAVEKITPRDVREFHTHLLTNGRRDGRGGLSAQTVVHIHRLLSEVLSTAVRERMIPTNPCQGVPLPKIEREEIRVADEEILGRVLAAAGDTWLRLPILLAACAGLRRGEVLGLAWSAVDFKAGVLTIRQQVQGLAGQPLTFRPLKSAKSRRAITVPEFLLEELVKHKGRQAAHRLQMGAAWEDHGLVVAQADGNPRTPVSLTHAFNRLVKDADLPPMTFHDLRHAAATVMLAAGVPLKVVSERLGHASVGITGDLYGHVTGAMDRDAAERTDPALRRAFGG